LGEYKYENIRYGLNCFSTHLKHTCVDETNSGALAAAFFAALVERLLLDFDDDDDGTAADTG
jgi:hypothetical protein